MCKDNEPAEKISRAADLLDPDEHQKLVRVPSVDDRDVQRGPLSARIEYNPVFGVEGMNEDETEKMRVGYSLG